MISINYVEKWHAVEILNTLRNEEGMNILTRLSSVSFNHHFLNHATIQSFYVSKIVNIIGCYQLDADNKALLNAANNFLLELESYIQFHIYDPTLNILFHKNTVKLFFNNLKAFILRLASNIYADENEVIGIISAGTSEYDLVSSGFIFLIMKGYNVIPRIDYGVDNLHRTVTLLKEINMNSLNIVTAGMEAVLFSVIGNLSFRPLLCVPSQTSYGLGKEGKASMLALLESDVPGLAIFNNANIFGACIFAINVINTIIRMKNRNAQKNKNKVQLESEIYANKRLHALSSKQAKLANNSLIANQIRFDKITNFHQFGFYKDSRIIIIYSDIQDINAVNECALLLKEKELSVEILKLDVSTTILYSEQLSSMFKDFDCIVIIGKNGSLVTMIGSINKSANCTIPIVALPMENIKFFITMINNCVNNIALVKLNDVKNCCALVFSILTKLTLADIAKKLPLENAQTYNEKPLLIKTI